MITRCTDWKDGLLDEFRRYRNLKYQPGSRDCILFASDVVRAMTGVDLAMGIPGTYTTMAELEWYLKNVASIHQIVDRVAEDAGMRRFQGRQGDHGDIALLEGPWNQGVGVFDDACRVLTFSHAGLTPVPIRIVTHFWRIL
jgi:hypothetical protein